MGESDMSTIFEGLPVKSVSIDNMLRQRDAALERIGVAHNHHVETP